MRELQAKERFQAIEYRPSVVRNFQKDYSESPKVLAAISELRNLYEEGIVQYTPLWDTYPLNNAERTRLRQIVTSSIHPARTTLRQPSLHACLSCLDTLPYSTPESLDQHEALSLHTRYVCPGCFRIARTQSALTRHLHRSRACLLHLRTFLGLEPWEVYTSSDEIDEDAVACENGGSKLWMDLKMITKVFAVTAHEAVEIAARRKSGKEPGEFLIHILRQQIVSFLFDYPA